MKKIAIITDFGDSHYPGILKGVISSIDSSLQVVDLTHHINPQNIIEAALVLRESIPYFDKETVFLVVVDPGVGSSRRGIVVRVGDRYFVGPDNGVFEFVYREGGFEIYEIIKEDFHFSQISSTFHGRDIFAPLSAYIAMGRDISGIIKEARDPVRLHIPEPDVSERAIMGEVLYIDSFGNLITNISGELIKDKRCSVKFKNRRLGRVRNTYSDVPRGLPVALIGSSGMLEIAINSGSAEKWFNVKRDRLKNIKVKVNIYPEKRKTDEHKTH